MIGEPRRPGAHRELITAQQLAQVWQCCEKTVFNRAANGLPFVPIGRSVRFDTRDVWDDDPPAETEREMLRAPQVADLLKISERTLRTLTKGGEIPSVANAPGVRYDSCELWEYIERRKRRKNKAAECREHSTAEA